MDYNEFDKLIWHPFTQEKTAPESICIVKAKDAVLYTKDGRELIDCNSSWWVNIHGHGNQEIKKAIHDQFDEIDHVIFAGFTHEPAIKLSKSVIKLLPNLFQKVFFSDNGSTSVEVALKMVIQYWYNLGLKRKKILAIEGAYHGDTFGAMSAGQRDYFNKPFEDYFFDVDFIPFPTNENESLTLANEKLSTGNYAALIVEPLVQGSAGMRMYSNSFLDQLMELAQVSDTLIIFDEVMTAWGRTGKIFAMDYCKSKPDIVCLSKGLTGGVLPLGLTVTTNKIYQAFYSDEKSKALLHGHSFTGNPLSCAAAIKSIELLTQPICLKKIQNISNFNKQFLQELKNINENLIVRFLGTILAIELPSKNDGYFADIRDVAYQYFIDNGLLLRPLGNVIFINPPYCITENQLKKIKKVITQFLSNITLQSDISG